MQFHYVIVKLLVAKLLFYARLNVEKHISSHNTTRRPPSWINISDKLIFIHAHSLLKTIFIVISILNVCLMIIYY